MSLVAVGSSRGAPGATTLTVALAATWPAERDLVIWEADAAGGVLAARYGLGDQPGLSTLAASTRLGRIRPEQLWEHTQQLPGGTPVVVGAESAEQASVVLAAVGGHLAEWFQQQVTLDVLADVGRLSPGSSSVAIAEYADVTLLVARPRLEELRPAAHTLGTLASAGTKVAWVLVGSGPYGTDDVADAFGIEVAGVIPDDPAAAEILVTGGSSRALRQSLLIRSARSLAENLAGRLDPQVAAAYPPPVDDAEQLAGGDEEEPQLGVVS